LPLGNALMQAPSLLPVAPVGQRLCFAWWLVAMDSWRAALRRGATFVCSSNKKQSPSFSLLHQSKLRLPKTKTLIRAPNRKIKDNNSGLTYRSCWETHKSGSRLDPCRRPLSLARVARTETRKDRVTGPTCYYHRFAASVYVCALCVLCVCLVRA